MDTFPQNLRLVTWREADSCLRARIVWVARPLLAYGAMVISGLVLTLHDAPTALARLAADPRVLLGALDGPKLPVVLETDTAQEGEALAEALGAVPGVTFVDVVTVHFGGEDGAA